MLRVLYFLQLYKKEKVRKSVPSLFWRRGRDYFGDIGHMDKDGFLFVDGRIKRVVIRHDGFKVYPSQIENAILKSKYINACCVVGVEDKDQAQGEMPLAFVVWNEQCDKISAKEELFEMCKKELPEYAQPIDFVFIEALPLTPIGKIDYRALENWAEEMSE